MQTSEVSTVATLAQYLSTPASTTCSWVVLVGRPNLELLDLALGYDAPILIALPDAGAIQELEEAWNRPWPPHVQCIAQLIGPEAGEAAWFHYNDPRHNGGLGPEALLPLYPNLRLRSVELRPTSTLADLLTSWEPAGVGRGLLVLSDDMGLAWLSGAGQTLREVEWLIWCPSTTAPTHAFAQPELDAALQEHWLTAMGPGIWQHDEAMAFRATVLRERDALLLECEQSRRINDQGAARIGELEAQQAALTAERDAISQANAAQQAQIGELEAQQAALTAERDQLAQEHDALETKATTQQDRLDRINSELDEILALLDQSPSEQT